MSRIEPNEKKWIGTKYGGLTSFDDINWIVYNTDNSGLLSDLVMSVEIDDNKCNGCGLCVAGCPVNMFEMIDDKPQRTKPIENCILCAECFHKCPVGAISYSYLSKAEERLNKMAKKMESPQSAVYPI